MLKILILPYESRSYEHANQFSLVSFVCTSSDKKFRAVFRTRYFLDGIVSASCCSWEKEYVTMSSFLPFVNFSFDNECKIILFYLYFNIIFSLRLWRKRIKGSSCWFLYCFRLLSNNPFSMYDLAGFLRIMFPYY